MRSLHHHFKHMTTVSERSGTRVRGARDYDFGRLNYNEAVIVDTWWQTETGGFLITTKPALDPMKPGSAGRRHSASSL